MKTHVLLCRLAILVAFVPLSWANGPNCLTAITPQDGCQYASPNSCAEATDRCTPPPNCNNPFQPCTLSAALAAANASDWVVLDPGTYTGNVRVTVPEVTVTGRSPPKGGSASVLVSGGVAFGMDAAGNPLESVIAIAAPKVELKQLQIVIPASPNPPPNRDLGVWVTPMGANARLENLWVRRLRAGERVGPDGLPAGPFSRGLFLLRAPGIRVKSVVVEGPFQHAIHAPASGVTVTQSTVLKFKQVGIIMVQESDTSVSENERISGNTVYCSGEANVGIEVQSDTTTVSSNVIFDCATDVRICGDRVSLASPLPPVCFYTPPVANLIWQSPARQASGTKVCLNLQGGSNVPGVAPASITDNGIGTVQC